MREAGGPRTEERMLNGMCANPTGGAHGRTARGPTQRLKDAMRRAAQRRDVKSAAKGSIEARTPRARACQERFLKIGPNR
jgi:hypothetical protein